ncbi:MAG: XrtA system polysaccharide chain length determinant [Sphingomonadales bacterium]
MGELYNEALVAIHGVWRRRWLALGVAWAIGLLGWLVISLIPNTYKSTATVFVQTGSLLSDKVGISSADQRQGIDTVRQNLVSQGNLEAIVRSTELAKHVASDRDVADKAASLQKAITITSTQDNLYQIATSVSEGGMSDAQNARLARTITAKLIDLFVAGSAQGGRVETGNSLQFIDAQIQQRGTQLAEVEAKRAAFDAKYLSSLPGTGSVSDRLGQARMELARVDSDLAAANSALAAVNGQLGGTPATTSTPGVASDGGRVGQIQGQIADGQARGWTDSHPDMIALRAQLARARAMGGGGYTGGSSSPNPMYMSLRSMQAERQATASALAARRAQLQGEIGRVLALQSSSPEFSRAQTEIDRDYQALKTQYDKLVADREDLKLRGQVQTQTDAVRVNVIDPPSMSAVPSAPNRPLLLTGVLIVAIGAGIGAAFAFGQLQTTYPTATRLARASGLPVLGSISEVVPAAARSLRRKRFVQFAGGAGALVGVYALLMIVEFVSRGFVA